MAKGPATPDLTSINLIGEGSEVEGSMRSTTDVRVNGRIKGDLVVEGKVIIADKGILDGTLKAQSADVAGTVVGELTIDDRLLLKSTAKIEGDIRTGRLVVEEGATFEGQCTMGKLDPARKALMGDGASASQPVLGESK